VRGVIGASDADLQEPTPMAELVVGPDFEALVRPCRAQRLGGGQGLDTADASLHALWCSAWWHLGGEPDARPPSCPPRRRAQVEDVRGALDATFAQAAAQRACYLPFQDMVLFDRCARAWA
jgi:hypothetical protein